MEREGRGEGKENTSAPDINSIPKWMIVFDLLASYLLSVLVIAFWRSSWAVCDEYIYPDARYKSIAVSFALGPGIILVATAILHDPAILLAARMNNVTRQIFLRVYIFIQGFAAVNNWRWLWHLLDELIGMGYLSSAISLGIGVLGLVLFRRLVNCVACPATVVLDLQEDSILKWVTFFGKTPGTWAYVGDCLFTYLVISTLVSTVWRGLWNVFDIGLFSEDTDERVLYSCLFSVALAAVMTCIREPVKLLSKWAETKYWWLKVAVEQLNMFLVFTYVVLMWLGGWHLIGRFVHGDPLRIFGCCAIGFFGTILCCASNTLTNRGCAQDGALPGGEGVLFDMRYLSNLILAYKALKMNQESQTSSECIEKHQDPSARIKNQEVIAGGYQSNGSTQAASPTTTIQQLTEQ